MSSNGDDMLNSNTKRCWELHQHVLWTWGTYCLFKHSRIDVPRGFPERIEFMVPRDSTHRYEIEEFLKHELDGMKTDPIPAEGADDVRWPGTEVQVLVVPFSGVQPYCDRDTANRIAQEGVKQFRQMMANWKRKREKDG